MAPAKPPANGIRKSSTRRAEVGGLITFFDSATLDAAKLGSLWEQADNAHIINVITMRTMTFHEIYEDLNKKTSLQKFLCLKLKMCRSKLDI